MNTKWLGLCFYPEMKLGIMQHFITNPDLRQNQTQIAQSLTIPKVKVSRCIDDLAQLKLLNVESNGRSLIYYLNKKSILVQKLFKPIVDINQTILNKWISTQVKLLPKHLIQNIHKIVLFGSAARGDMNVRSDVDLLMILKKQDDELPYHHVLVADGSNAGLNINLHFTTLKNWGNKLFQKPYLTAARSEGELIWKNK